MTRDGLMRLNKTSLIIMIEELKRENRLLKKDVLFTCNDCGREFDYEQVEQQDWQGNVLCPYCHCGDISKEFIE